jgi:hypothetical protein
MARRLSVDGGVLLSQSNEPLPDRARPETAGRTLAQERLDSTLSPDPSHSRGNQNPARESHGETHSRTTCFRITGVPLAWDQEKLEEWLAKTDWDFKGHEDELSIFPSCSASSKSKIALLRLKRNPTCFEGSEQSGGKQYLLKEKDQKVRLNIDKHFYGLTQLNKPNTPITAEFVNNYPWALSGILIRSAAT